MGSARVFPQVPTRRTAAWTPRVMATTATLAAALLMHGATLAAPRWATGATYHVASSSAFNVNLAAGLWGYCTTPTVLGEGSSLAISADGVATKCFAFYFTTADQDLSVCEAYSRGFVYGTDDVRGVRFPSDANDNVHRIERPPTSLDDGNIERFIEKSCSVEGITTLAVSLMGFVVGLSTLIAFVWTHGKHESQFEILSGSVSEANSSLLEFSSITAFTTVLLWLHQSWDLRQTDDTGERVSIRLGSAMYAQILIAALYCFASLGVVSSAHEQARRNGSILKI